MKLSASGLCLRDNTVSVFLSPSGGVFVGQLDNPGFVVVLGNFKLDIYLE